MFKFKTKRGNVYVSQGPLTGWRAKSFSYISDVVVKSKLLGEKIYGTNVKLEDIPVEDMKVLGEKLSEDIDDKIINGRYTIVSPWGKGANLRAFSGLEVYPIKFSFANKNGEKYLRIAALSRAKGYVESGHLEKLIKLQKNRLSVGENVKVKEDFDYGKLEFDDEFGFNENDEHELGEIFGNEHEVLNEAENEYDELKSTTCDIRGEKPRAKYFEKVDTPKGLRKKK
jgi:hypothetical protein